MQRKPKILLISTIQADWTTTTAPVIRAVKEAFNTFDYDVVTKNDVFRDEATILAEAAHYNLFVQIFDTFYFPHGFLYKLYTRYKTPTIYWCFDYLNYPFSKIKSLLEEHSVVFTNVKHIMNFNPKYLVQLNLNALICDKKQKSFPSRPFWCIYYGSYRRDREKYFAKYLKRPLVLSTSKRNLGKFGDHLKRVSYIEPMDWNNPILKYFKFSLYIEDVYTHTHFNYLASRFYEALNYDVIPIFDSSCMRTIRLSGYPIPKILVVDSFEQIPENLDFRTERLFEIACEEKRWVKKQIRKLVMDIAA